MKLIDVNYCTIHSLPESLKSPKLHSALPEEIPKHLKNSTEKMHGKVPFSVNLDPCSTNAL